MYIRGSSGKFSELKIEAAGSVVRELFRTVSPGDTQGV